MRSISDQTTGFMVSPLKVKETLNISAVWRKMDMMKMPSGRLIVCRYELNMRTRRHALGPQRLFSSSWLCQQNYCRGAVARRVSRKPVDRSRPNLWAPPYPPYFQTIFVCFNFHTLRCVFVNIRPHGSKKFKTLLLQFFIRTEPNFMINRVGKYKVIIFWRSAKNEKKYGTLKFFLTWGHIGLK